MRLRTYSRPRPAGSLRSYAMDLTATRGQTNGSMIFRGIGPRSVGEPDKRSAVEPVKRILDELNSPLGSRSCRRSCENWGCGRTAN